MMPTQASQRLPHKDKTQIELIQRPVQPSVEWVVRERVDGQLVEVHRIHNLVTNYGQTALAAAPSGLYTPPIYLVVEQSATSMYSQANPGDTTIYLNGNPTLVDDTQLVLSPGLVASETVTFTSIVGSAAPFVVTLSAGCANTHPVSDPVVRAPNYADTMASVLSEVTVDPTNNPNNRVAQTSAYSPGQGQNTMQFFISGATATNIYFAHVGLADQQSMSALNTNLHNYAALGYNHTNTNDVEIDVTWTITPA